MLACIAAERQRVAHRAECLHRGRADDGKDSVTKNGPGEDVAKPLNAGGKANPQQGKHFGETRAEIEGTIDAADVAAHRQEYEDEEFAEDSRILCPGRAGDAARAGSERAVDAQ